MGVEELHSSTAGAQDCFFDHIRNHVALYNAGDASPGQCILINKQFLESRGISTVPRGGTESDSDSDVNMDVIDHHHVIFIAMVAHAFWWQEAGRTLLFVNVYLDAHDAGVRCSQLRQLNLAL